MLSFCRTMGVTSALKFDLPKILKNFALISIHFCAKVKKLIPCWQL